MTAVWPAIRLLLRRGGIAIGCLILVALLPFAAAWLINLRDEPLTPEAQALLVPPPDAYAPEDNIYVALAGLDAPAGESVTAVGLARIERFNHQVDVSADEPRLEFRGDIGFCVPLDRSVWNDAPAHATEIAKLLTDNAELYQRYVDLHRRQGFYETARPSMTAPPVYLSAQSIRKLFLADVALRLRNDEPRLRRAALADLTGDVRLWRAVLTGRGTLISKMVAVAHLEGDYLVLADMIADSQAAVPVGAADADAVVPLFALGDWNIGSTFAEEFRFEVATLELLQRASASGIAVAERYSGDMLLRSWNRLESTAGAHFFKLHATENLFAGNAAQLIASAAADPAAFAARSRQPRVSPPAGEPSWTALLSYNPTGKVLAAIAARNLADYAPRAWDGAALQRLVRLSYELRRQGIEAASLPAFLEQHPEWSTHPGDGRPFLWDAESGELRIRTMGRQPAGRRFSIRVWQSHSGHALAPPAAPR
ncbi:MAG TPA: hypothetical protein VH111_01155 [Steroidobacteraceae bacterium]|nr:hypothetical protein [Steroidobacteraceae bacterium]